MIFDYVTRIYMNEDGTFQVNGCAICGFEERRHYRVSSCITEENPNGAHVQPSDALRLQRMKANRAIRSM